MNKVHPHLFYRPAKDDQLKASQLRRIKYFSQISLERVYNKSYIIEMKKLIKKLISNSKFVRKLKLTHTPQGLDPIQVANFFKDLHQPIQNRLNQCLKVYKGITNITRMKNMRGLTTSSVFWDNKKSFEVPSYLRSIKHLDIQFKIKEPQLGTFRKRM